MTKARTSPTTPRRSARTRAAKRDEQPEQPSDSERASDAADRKEDESHESVSGGAGDATSSAPRQDPSADANADADADANTDANTNAATSATAERASETASTTTLRIDNFRRPFTLPAVKAFLQQTGPFVENGFWMNSIKTHCFVTYASTELAERTKARVDGVVWPPETGVALAAVFSEQTAVEINNGAVPEPPGAASAGPHKRKASHDAPPTSARRRPAAKSLDALFRKTETKPVLYYLPVPDEEVRQRRERRARRVPAA
ncbi:hypothetical protein ATCC90586_006726 [Pythium insidiosum]|nr:hypothetical protein ATCC90586_006726 [Pythium insidiosum]